MIAHAGAPLLNLPLHLVCTGKMMNYDNLKLIVVIMFNKKCAGEIVVAAPMCPPSISKRYTCRGRPMCRPLANEYWYVVVH